MAQKEADQKERDKSQIKAKSKVGPALLLLVVQKQAQGECAFASYSEYEGMCVRLIWFDQACMQ